MTPPTTNQSSGKEYSFDRHGNVFELPPLNEKSTQEEKWAREVLNETRGIYNSYEEAEVASKPIEVRTGTGKDDFYYI